MSSFSAHVWPVLGCLLAATTLVGTLDLLLLTVAGMLRPRRDPTSGDDGGGLAVAVVVPAHDEEDNVAETVASLFACDGADRACEVVVVADNCTDGTARVAAAAGARVLERNDAEHRGKGWALDFAFRILMAERFDAFVVVDADTIAAPTMLSEMRRALHVGADAVQARYLTLQPERSLRTRLLEIAFAGINVVRPRGRERLGLSCGIVGSGFGMSRATLEALPYEARSIVEDLEYHLRLVRSGRRVRFLDRTTVRGAMPQGGAGARSQRARWEGGRLAVLRQQLPQLLGDLLRGRLRLLEPAADLLLLPLGYHVVLLLAACAVPFAPTQGYAACGVAVVAVHVLVALRLAGGGARDLMALATAPVYVLWKLGLSRRILGAARPDAAWVRTTRDAGDS